MGEGETVDILWPDESALRKIEEADQFVVRSHIDPQTDFHFIDTVRKFESSTSNILQPITITLSYPDVSEMEGTTLVGPSSLSQDDELSLRVFRLNELSRVPRWELVPGSQRVDTVGNSVSAESRMLGVFRVALLKLPESLDRVVVYPNPFIPSQSNNGCITFKNLTENATIEVFDMAGRRVRTVSKVGGGDEATWDVRNSGGDRVASGTYVFVVQSDGDDHVGKVVILR